MKLEKPIAFIDIESTGVDPVKDRIIEFGAAILLLDGTRTEWVQRFNPGIPISPEAAAVHGITDAEVADEPAFSVWAKRIFGAIKGKDLAGYNLRRFDLPILDEELRRCGGKLDLEGVRVIDCFGIYTKKNPRRLEDFIREHCDHEHVGAHGALADANGTAEGFLGVLRKYPDLAEMSIDDLAAYSQTNEQRFADIAGKLYYDAENDACYAFGKHKDRKVKEEPSYAHWMLSKDFPGSTCEVLEAVLGKIEAAQGLGDHAEDAAIASGWRG